MDQMSFGRRGFLKGTMAAAAAAGLGPEEQILMTHLAQAETTPAAASTSGNALPVGKIKDVTVSRLICGGNLIGGWAHSRDLIYVSDLFKAYNTDDKIMETLQICEENGVNTILTNPVSGPVINRYWKDRGGKIQWISEVHPTPGDVTTGVRAAVDAGASLVYIQGGVGDRLHREKHLDTMAATMEAIKDHGVPAGIGAHSLDVVIDCEAGGVNPDFYVKTLHPANYWSAQRPTQTAEVIDNGADNYWCIDPDKTVATMQAVEKPWIAFKVLAAGAIHPRDGFRYAFDHGADFVCVGMFDFQVAEDAAVLREVLGKVERARKWYA